VPDGTRVRLFLELANDGGLQLSVTAPSAVVGIPHGMARNRITLLSQPGLLEIFQTILALLNNLLKDIDPILQRSITRGP
jgi:hypothetical protein